MNTCFVLGIVPEWTELQVSLNAKWSFPLHVRSNAGVDVDSAQVVSVTMASGVVAMMLRMRVRACEMRNGKGKKHLSKAKEDNKKSQR